MEKMRLLLISSSYYNHGPYLGHARPQIEALLQDVKTVTFVPYARPGGISHDTYTERAAEGLKAFGKDVIGVHESGDPVQAIRDAEAVFIGGGNTFLLLRDMYAHGIVEPLRERGKSGMPYMGTSAGSNVAGLTIGTSNDMPIIHPPTFDALGLVPFNINPHFPRHKPDADHMGETREDRIHEFHNINSQPVVAIREDSMLSLEKGKLRLMGTHEGVLFRAGEQDEVLPSGEHLNHLL